MAKVAKKALERLLRRAAPIAAGAGLAVQSDDAEAAFLGVGAKMADKFMLGVAQKMKAEGISPDEIWRKTGWAEGVDDKWRFEVPDNEAAFGKTSNPDSYVDILDEAQEREGGIPLGRAFNHPEWYRNYPDLGAMRLSVKGDEMGRMHGYYAPSSDSMSLKDPFDVPASLGYDPRSTLLHEGQHAIQAREGFAKGGSPENAAMIGERLRKDKLKPLIDARGRYSVAASKMGDIDRAEYISQLGKIVDSENPKPSSVTGLSDWYKYSDEIRSAIGSMPKTKAAGRDEWVRSAAQFIRNKNLEELGPYERSVVQLAKDDPKELAKRKRRAKKEMDTFGKDARKAGVIDRKFSEFAKLPEHEQYRRLAGEVEARNVQSRADMTLDERRQNPPWVTEDVPRHLQIGAADPRLLAGISAAGGGAALAPAVNPYSPTQIGTALLQRGGPLMQQEAVPAKFPALHRVANLIGGIQDPTGLALDTSGTADYLRNFGEGNPSFLRALGAMPF